MTTKDLSLVLPELRAFLTEFDNLTFSQATITALRQQGQSLAAENAAGVITREHQIDSYDNSGKIRLKLYIPDNHTSNKPALLYFHGGGYLFGFPEDKDSQHKRLCRQFNLVVVGVDYRLAPEHRYPAAQEDGYCSLRWLYDNAASLGIDETKIMLWGCSAGGGIAAALSLMVRQRQEFKLHHQFLIYPMLDDRTCYRKHLYPQAGNFIWTAENNLFAWQAMTGMVPGSTEITSYAAPARETDLTNLAPAFISVGSLDLFAQESITYTQNLLACGTPAELHVYPGCYHAFDVFCAGNMQQKWRSDFDHALRRALD